MWDTGTLVISGTAPFLSMFEGPVLSFTYAQLGPSKSFILAESIERKRERPGILRKNALLIYNLSPLEMVYFDLSRSKTVTVY